MEKVNNKEKICMFFASDYHFEMISVPYINKNLKNNKNVIVITENDLNQTIEEFLSKVNIKEEEKNSIRKLDWKNDDENKLKELKNLANEKKDTVVFIKGEENFISNINNKIKDIDSDKSIKIVDCYDISEVQDSVRKIVDGYSEILSTSGIEKLLYST